MSGSYSSNAFQKVKSSGNKTFLYSNYLASNADILKIRHTNGWLHSCPQPPTSHQNHAAISPRWTLLLLGGSRCVCCQTQCSPSLHVSGPHLYAARQLWSPAVPVGLYHIKARVKNMPCCNQSIGVCARSNPIYNSSKLRSSNVRKCVED